MNSASLYDSLMITIIDKVYDNDYNCNHKY